jgi:hypothetical protein
VDGLEKDLAQGSALSSSLAERLQQHPLDVGPRPTQSPAADEHEKTLFGVAIGATWDLVAGKGKTSEARVERAQKADQYAEIAADTFASIPKYKALTGGIARSVLLIDVSGQNSAGDVAKGMALNFMEGMALNSVSRMASSESVVGKLVTGRLGVGLSAEVATHAISGGGFGLVKSGMSQNSWIDARGNFSLTTGLKNVATGTSVGTLIGIPAGMAGLRVGRAVTLGLGNQVEHSVVASTVQKFAVGGGAGFASGSVFGGVDAAKSGKSWSQILDSSWQGGMVGLVTGGVASGFDHSPIRAAGVGDGQVKALAEMKTAAKMEAGNAASPKGVDHARDVGVLQQTTKMLERADYLMAPENMREAYDRLSYKPVRNINVEDFAHRLKAPVIENRQVTTLKESAPKTYEEYQKALKKLKATGEPLDYDEHFVKPFVIASSQAMRIYGVEGHTTKIVVPEAYAKQLDEVREIRKISDAPTALTRLTKQQSFAALTALNKGDASPLAAFMTPAEMKQVITVFQAGATLRAHPLGQRALPEDLVPILDALPNRNLLKEVHVLDERNLDDLYKAMLYDAPGFVAAATVGREARVYLHQANHGSALYETLFHEWGHVAKWQSPTFSKIFDLASIVDHIDQNHDYQATDVARVADPRHEPITSASVYYPSLHSSRTQDENFAVGLGEEMMGSDPNKLFAYVGRAPVRGMTLATALENNLMVDAGRNESSMFENMMDRAKYASEAARPYAIGVVQRRLADGTPVEKAAAAQLMGVFGTREQGQDLLAAAGNKANKVVPEWEGSLAKESMEGDGRTVSQHAFDAYIALMHKPEPERFNAAMGLLVQKPELREEASDYIAQSTDPRRSTYLPLVEMYNPKGTATERAVGVELLKAFGGENKADLLLSIALQKGNDRSPNFRDTDIPPQFIRKYRTVSQLAYNAYVEASAGSPVGRYEFAFKNGLEKPNQRELASQYLAKVLDDRAQGLGQFLEMRDLPGHVSKMQELIDKNFRHDAASQKMVFDQMMHLTDSDPRRQMELITKNLHGNALIGSALQKMDAMLAGGTTRQQREEIDYAVSERMRWDHYPQEYKTRLTDLLSRVTQENKLQDALAQIDRSITDRVAAVHELSVLHDQRAIKPLLQQAVSGNGAVEAEAIGALRQFSPAIVKFYAQELKREMFSNPSMTGKITELLSSHRLTPAGDALH